MQRRLAFDQGANGDKSDKEKYFLASPPLASPAILRSCWGERAARHPRSLSPQSACKMIEAG